jgi:hypothetical protein
VAGTFRITHTITDGSAPLSIAAATSITLRVIDQSDNYTNLVVGAISTNEPGVVRWNISTLNARTYRLMSTINFPGDSFPVFDRYLTVTSTPAQAISSALNIYNPTVTQEINVVTAPYSTYLQTAPSTVTLAQAASATNAMIAVRKVGGTGNVVVLPYAGDNINGESQILIQYQNSSAIFVSDGTTNWSIF